MFEEENGAKKILLSSLLGLGISLGSSIILILLSALILSSLKDPGGAIFQTGAAILYITSLAGGFVSKLKGEKLISPMLSGAVMTLFVLAVSMSFIGKSSLSPVGAAFAYPAVFAAFTAGGLIHTLASSKRPHRRRTNRRR